MIPPRRLNDDQEKIICYLFFFLESEHIPFLFFSLLEASLYAYYIARVSKKRGIN